MTGRCAMSSSSSVCSRSCASCESQVAGVSEPVVDTGSPRWCVTFSRGRDVPARRASDFPRYQRRASRFTTEIPAQIGLVGPLLGRTAAWHLAPEGTLRSFEGVRHVGALLSGWRRRYGDLGRADFLTVAG